MRILALDIGSSAIKAGLWNGRRFTAFARETFPTTLRNLTAEVPTHGLLQALLRAGAIASRTSLDAISFCTFSSGVILTDSNGTPRTPIITHADRRSILAAQRLVQQHGEEFWLRTTGNVPYPGGIGASTLAWLRKERPPLLKDARIGQLSSFIARLLTGAAWTIDPSQAAFLGLLDIRTGTWSPEACQAVDIPVSSLPTIQFADTRLGTLGPAFARHWNLPTGIPIIGGFIDTSAAVIQTPMTPGQLTHSAGSTDVLAMIVKQPLPESGILTRPVGTGAKLPERWLAVRTIASAGSALAWTRQTLFPNIDDSAWSRTLARTGRAAGVTPPEAPWTDAAFLGERASIDPAPGATFRHLRIGTTADELLAAIIRALVRDSVVSYTRLRSRHRPANAVYVMGAATALGKAMHRAWPAPHAFVRLPGDSLRGLVLLASAALR